MLPSRRGWMQKDPKMIYTSHSSLIQAVVKGDGLRKKYSSFAEYVLESRNGLSSPPVPVVKPAKEYSALSIPVITIIGVQKGGTANLRVNLMTYPMLSGIWGGVHFFDQAPSEYPNVGQWEGDGLEHDIGIDAAGEILSGYAEECSLQILVIEASETFADFITAVDAVMEFAGLPGRSVPYDPARENQSGGCEKQDHRQGNDYFVHGGRYEAMVEEAELIREWYRPHNERLYKLLGRHLMWK